MFNTLLIKKCGCAQTSQFIHDLQMKEFQQNQPIEINWTTGGVTAVTSS